MDAVEDIKARLDVVDVIGEYLQLKPAGSGSFKANCPFHQEKTPSFFVNRPRQSWHCFGCNIGGDMISFVEKVEGMEFMEALELLAQKAGIQLPKFDQKIMGVKKRLQDVNDYVAKLYQHTLISDAEANVAREYIKKRGIDDLTADIWRIGYSPADWSGLEKKLKEQGFNSSDLIEAGIAAAKEHGQGIYYRFRSRLMFPIWDAFGHVIGFTGRILTDEKTAKYINTPETALYKKSAVLYGLDKAKAHIKREDLAILVEGNMDALTSHQFGVQNVVATSGTALSFEQLSLLKRFSSNLAIAFDMDSAGTMATLRGLDMARQMEFSIKVISYDSKLAKDPDELIRKDVELWKDAVRKAKPIMEWIYVRAFTQFSPQTPEGKKDIAQFVLNECRHIQHPVERDAWIAKLAKALDISPDALRSALARATDTKNRSSQLVARSSQTTDDRRQGEKANSEKRTAKSDLRDVIVELEARWLAAIMLKEDLFHSVKFNWSVPPHALLYRALNERYTSRINQSDGILNTMPANAAAWDLDQDLKQLVDYLAMLADREFQDQTPAGLEKELTGTEKRLEEYGMVKSLSEIEQQMREAERLGDTERIKALLAQFNHLNDPT